MASTTQPAGKARIRQRKSSSRLKTLLKNLGPGLITGASDDDPSGIITYTQAGSQFGLATLWTALLTFPLMAAMQGMAARIGLVTSQGLTGTLRVHYPKWLLFFVLLFCFPAVILNIGADIQSMGAVTHLLFPVIPAFSASIFFAGLLLFVIIRYPYQKMAGILKWLCIGLLLYLIVPFLVHPHWPEVAKSTFIPTIRFDKDFLGILVAILGTTISPYLFFWQATMEAEEEQHNTRKKRIVVDKKTLDNMRSDVNIGMFFSNFVMFFVILTAGSVLFVAGTKHIETVEQAAQALKPLAGDLSYTLFAVGVIGTGLLAIPVLAGSISYMLAETLQFSMGLDKKFNEARRFYSVIFLSLLAGLAMQFSGISPVKALLYTAILYGLTSPVLIAVILHIGNNKKIMGKHTNTRLSNILGFLTLILMTASAVALVYFSF
ncbi:MAG TPA: Nramp family divalent metal transporter [Puia sp.]|uniref:Nramp family divalent metal transporter n=1 Tax=Puia sp. TaxID=2045100 RepID=UPI002C1314C1|nr:Nramp family divalent metal transporter [Puia sp.]HVU98168.1 Nramp family divalent metal transporter [Puia sp.]